MAQTALAVKNVSIAYSSKKSVISEINLKLEEGKILGIIGLNGVGKTTLIKSILGFRPVDTGNIEIFGKNVYDMNMKKRLAYLPEKFEPPLFLTGEEFLKFSFSIYGKKISFSKMQEEAKKLSLDESFLKKRVSTYSKGMRQKLGLLGTILTQCDFIILDEPMSGLDPKARKLVKEMLMGIKAEGKTIILSTHILADMKELCDEVAIINQGKIYFSGTPEEMVKIGKDKDIETSFMNIIGI